MHRSLPSLSPLDPLALIGEPGRAVKQTQREPPGRHTVHRSPSIARFPSRRDSMGCGGSKSADETFDSIECGQTPASGKASGNAPCKAATPASTKKAKEQAAKEQKAAETVQKHMRGSIARTKVENMKRPCDEYSVNMNAANFGECMCGWPKADHATSAFVKKKKTMVPTKVDSADLRNRFVKVCAVIVSIFCLRILSAECTREGFDSALWGMQVYINDQLVGLYNLMEAPDQGKPQTSLVFTNLNRAAY